MEIGANVLAFHKLAKGLSYGSTNYTPERFDKLLSVLRSSGPLPLITFDDGYQHLVDQLPGLMNRFDIKPIVFIPTAWIGQPNSWDYSHWFRNEPHLNEASIRQLSDLGAVIGSHGHRHTDLTALNDADLAFELSHSKTILEEITGAPVTAISYPFGRVNRRITEAARFAGYASGYTMQFPTPNDSPLERGRVAVYGYDTTGAIRRKLSGQGIGFRIERSKARITNLLSGGTILFNRLRRHKVD